MENETFRMVDYNALGLIRMAQMLLKPVVQQLEYHFTQNAT